MRRYDTGFPNDEPEAVIAERVEAIAFDLERIAEACEAIAADRDDDFEGFSYSGGPL